MSSKICSRDGHALTLAHTERCQASSANFQARISYRSKIIPTSRLTKRILVSLASIYIGTQRAQNALRLFRTPVPELLTAMVLYFASLWKE
ncbi:hypothetical protein ARMSODRAFT_506790 [Armillaria solidipes]|uniref:Uncharacterized protein n=1 Tax=Armillaria solidipes TaxID=1076256 RepID=A0A2H3BZU2_9AGAR|nr:hypothetical protein ARMSODRAFT_506790 [Armillaria solidipes]